MVWLSYYEEYPIYEPAEGGYYYAGLTLVSTERLSKRAAKRKFDAEAEELLKFADDGWIKLNGRHLAQDSKYIGEGAFFCVERKKGMHERGYVPYC